MRYPALILLCLIIGCTSPGASSPKTMTPPPTPVTISAPTLVTREAPDFTAEAVMPDNRIGNLSLSSYRGKYVILFFYPLDFTFVCPTEILAFNERLSDFKKVSCEVIAVSTDSTYAHLAWKNTPVKAGGIGKIQFPLVSDMTKDIARSFGILHDESVALRGLFLIDTKGKIRHALVNDLAVGRSVDEAMRTLSAVQMVDQYGAFCPANWKPGDPTLEKAKKFMQEYFLEQNK